MPIFVLQHLGIRGGRKLLRKGVSEGDALAAFDRALSTLVQGSLTLHRTEGGQSLLVKRGDAIPLDKRKRRGSRQRTVLPREITHDLAKPWPPKPDDE